MNAPVMPAVSPSAPVVLSPLQCAWLAEIGVDRRQLMRHMATVDKAGTAKVKVTAAPVSVHRTGTDALQHVRTSLAGLGGTQGVCNKPATGTDVGNVQEPVSVNVGAPVTADIPLADVKSLTELEAHAWACQACDLYAQRDRLVFGAGSVDEPDWLIIGEAPGQSDDRTGMPFQGKSGQLLHAMLVSLGVHPASINLGSGAPLIPRWSTPIQVYFTNLIKCRPLGNRSPTEQEIAACQPYLYEQIARIRPKRILALGRLAAQTLLQVTDELDDLRGQVHQIELPSGQRIPLVATWHPTMLLMHPQHKALAWEDLKLAQQMV